jgi:hypothetical protein
MECSTTELRQHARYQGIGLVGPSGGRFLPQGPLWRKRGGGPGKYQNRVKLTPMDRDPVMGQFRASLPVPDPVRHGQIPFSAACHRTARRAQRRDCAVDDPNLLQSNEIGFSRSPAARPLTATLHGVVFDILFGPSGRT